MRSSNSTDRTWDFAGLPVHLTNNFTIGAGSTLTVTPGTVVKMPQGAFFSVDGTLSAVATPERKIILTSTKDDSAGGDSNNDGPATTPARGEWESLTLNSTSDASMLQHVEVRFAGNTANPGNGGGFIPAVQLSGSDAVLRNFLVQDADSTGIRINSGAPTLDQVHVTRATGVPYFASLSADPIQTSLTAANNSVEAYLLDGGTLASNRTWDVTTMPYMFTNNFAVGGGTTLTVKPGVVLKMTAGQLFDVSGTLDAQGTLTQPIVFTDRADDTALGDSFHDAAATTPVPGSWEAIRIFGPGTVLDHVDIRYAGNTANPGNGGGFTPALQIAGTSPTVRNSRVLSSDSTGVSITGAAQPILNQVHVEGSRHDAFFQSLAANPTLTALSATNNGADRVLLEAGTLSENRTWDFGGLPIHLTNNFTVGSASTLTVTPGMVIKLPQGAFFSVDGTLAAVGTPDRPIIFTSDKDDSAGGDSNNDGTASSPLRGAWEALYLNSTSDASVLEHVEVRYAGNTANPGNGGGFTPAVQFTGSDAVVRNFLVRDADSTGIRLNSGAPTLDRVHVTHVSGVPYFSSLSANPMQTALTAADNSVEAYLIDGGTLTGNRIWDVTSLPYMFTNNFSVGGGTTLTIKPGVVVKMDTGQYFEIDGILDARGTIAQPIIVTARADDTGGGDSFHDGAATVPVPGSWESLYFDAPGSMFDYLDIRYGGNTANPGNGGGFTAALHVRANLSADNLTVRQTEREGIQVSSGAAFTMIGGLLIGHPGAALYVDSGSANVMNVGFFSGGTGVHIDNGESATVAGSAFEQLTNGVIHQGTNVANATFENNWWGDAGGPNDPSNADGEINNNPLGVNVSNFVDYRPFSTIRPALPIGPIVLSVSPTLSSAAVASVDVTFSEPVSLATFTESDIAVSGPQATTVSGITQVGAATYRVSLSPPLSAGGNYLVSVGPDITAAGSGFTLDQDRDGTGAETPDDIFSATVRVDRTGQRVTSQSPTGTIEQAFRSFDVTFDEPIAATSFTPNADVTITGPNADGSPGRAIQTLSVTPLSSTTFRVGFDVQFLNGTYTFTIGPDVRDAAGNAMDQDADATNNEATDDQYTGSFTLDRKPLKIVAQDPDGFFLGGVTQIDVTFSAPIVAGTFGANDVSVVGPNGFATVTGVTQLSPVKFRIGVQRITAEGEYTVRVGPEIADAGGIFMDQDGDGTPGEPEDRHQGTFSVGGVGPAGATFTPLGTVAAPVTEIFVNFSEPIATTSFSPVDASVSGPQGGIAVIRVDAVDADTFKLTLPTQAIDGVYNFAIGPFITDVSGTNMDQDGDGVIGEPVDDRFTGTFTIDAIGPTAIATMPAGTVEQPLSNVTVEFSEAIGAATISPADVGIAGPNGPVAVSSITLVDATHFRISFATQQTPGVYNFSVGPDITDLVGNKLNQDGDATFGEPSDAFAFAITLALPDLTIQTDPAPVVPAVVFNGEQLAVEYVVKNIGTGTAVTPWSDRAVLSTDEFFGNSDDIVLGTTSAEANLAPGATVTRTGSAQVPFGIQGSFRVFFRTDRLNQVIEGGAGGEANNLISVPIEVMFAPPPADLVVDATSFTPVAAQTGDVVNVTWRVANAGTAATPTGNWSDRLVLSDDATFGDADDITLGTFAHSGTVAAAGTYTETRGVQIPVAIGAGQYRFFIVTDVANQLTEPGAENNNVGSTGTIDVTLAPVPDLIVVTAGPAVAGTPGAIGQPFTATWTVRNVGGAAAPAGSWNDKVYLSPDGTLNGASLLGSFRFTAGLLTSQEYSRSEPVTLPNRPDGDYFIVVVTDSDGEVFERAAEGNNTTASAETVRVTHSDLVIDQVSLPGGAAAESSSTINVEWTGRNAGTGATPASWTDRVYLSSDATLSGDDVLLGSLPHSGSVAAAVTYNASLAVRLPDGVTGSRRILIESDPAGDVMEGVGEGNNVGATDELTISLAPFADLTVFHVDAPAITIGDPVDLTVTWEVRNDGTGPSTIDSWIDRVVLSRDMMFGNGDDQLLGEFEHTGALPVGSSYPRTEIFPLPPATEARFFLFVQTDAAGVVFEHTDTAPNVGTPGQPVDVVRKPYADLVVDEVTVEPTGTNGGTADVSWMVSNVGIGLTDDIQWSDRMYLSRDTTFGNGDDRFLGSFSHAGALGVNDGYSRDAEVTLPADADGLYFVFVQTGGPFEFIYTNNNVTRSTGQIDVTFIPPPQGDLEVTSVVAPAAAQDSDLIEVTWTARNNGPDDITVPWVDRVYLAPTSNPLDRTRIADFFRSDGLEAGKTHTRTELIRVPQRQGQFQFFVETDVTRRLAEANEANNVFFSQPITLTLRPRPDLQVTRIESPQQVTAGAVIDVSFIVTNLGTAATPTGGSRWFDRVWLSLDNQLGGDILLGELPNGSALAVGQNYSTAGVFGLPEAVAGNVFIILQADARGSVDEFPQDGNNTFVVPLAVDAVPVPPPDLVVTSVATPLEAFDDSVIRVRYRVDNLGAGITFPAGWGDQVWLTRTKDRPNPARGDRYLGSFGNPNGLDVNEFYENAVDVRIPAQTTGQFFITVWADGSDAVFENAFATNLNPDAENDLEGSNFKATPISIFLTPTPDLEVTAVTAPATGLGGEQVTITYTVANNGSAATDRDRWADAIYLSTDDSLSDGLGQQFLMFAVPHVGALDIGQSYSETATFTLPPSAAGSHFIVQTNVDPRITLTEEELFLQQMKEIFERAEAALGKPLLEVSAADIAQLSRQDVLEILTGGNDDRLSTVFEGPHTNNNTRADESNVTNVPADLIVTNVTADPAAFSGEPVTVNWTVTNVGPGPAWSGVQRWIDRVWMSPDPIYIADRATLVATVPHGQTDLFEVGDSYSASATVTLPAAISTYSPTSA